MKQDIPFLERADYMQNGVKKYDVFCPLTEGIQKKQLGKPRSKRPQAEQGADPEPEPEPSAKQVSALYQQYCPELHKMIGYMRRLDGAYPNTSRGFKVMDPLAPDGEPKLAVEGRRTPYFGWWAFYAWEEVFYPVFVKIMGSIVLVNDEEDVDALCEAEVMV